MAAVVKDNLVDQLADYDFNTPINVTVVYEDNDDVSNSNKNYLTEINYEEIEDDKHDTGDNITILEKCLKEPKSHRTEVNNTLGQENKKSNDDLSGLDRLSNKNPKHNINRFKKPIKETTKTCFIDLDDEQNRYNIQTNKHSSLVPIVTDSTSTTNCVHLNSDKNQVEKCNLKTCQSRKRKSSEPIINNTSIQKNIPNETHSKIQRLKDGVHYKENQNKSTCDNLNVPESSTRDLSIYKNDYTRIGLLTFICENLILIMNTYYQTKKASVINNKINIMKKANPAFCYLRTYIYELSYEVIVDLILPEENNLDFINKFLENTIKIAVNKKGLKYCTRQYVEPFFLDMLHWAKKRKEQRSFKDGADNNSTLTQYLRPSVPPSYSSTSNVEVNNVGNTCRIFSSGAPGKEISINVNPNVFTNINNASYSTSQNLNANYMQDVQGNVEYHNNAINNISNITIIPNENQLSVGYQQSQSSIDLRSVRLPRMSEHYLLPQANNTINTGNIHTSSNLNIIDYQNSLEINKYYNNYQRANSTTTNINENNSTGDQSSEHTFPNYNRFPTTPLMPSTNYGTAIRPPPPYHSTIDNQSANNYQETMNRITHNLQENHPDRTRSASTESGYASPSNTLNMNQTDGGLPDDQQISIPVISNVISLNQEYLMGTKNNCHMCGKDTEMVCSGCQRYYCSNICKQLDKVTHSAVCWNS